MAKKLTSVYGELKSNPASHLPYVFCLQKEEDCKMEMNKKYARTTPAQLRLYVAFCKDHPELLQGKNCPISPHLITKLWEEISAKLNAMVGPSRTPDAWRESLRNWRKQLRARARKLAAGRRQTGGGQNTAAELTDFEQQALEVFGVAAIEGHSTSRLGFQNVNNAENVPPAPEQLPAQVTPPVPDDPAEFAEFCLVVSESPSQTLSRPVTPNPVPSNPDAPNSAARSSAAPSAATPRAVLLPTPRNRRRGARDEILELVQQDRRDRRHEQARLAQSLDNLGNGLTSLAAAIQAMVSLQRQHRD